MRHLVPAVAALLIAMVAGGCGADSPKVGKGGLALTLPPVGSDAVGGFKIEVCKPVSGVCTWPCPQGSLVDSVCAGRSMQTNKVLAEWSLGNACSNDFNFGNLTNSVKIGQGWKAIASGNITDIDLKLDKVGAPTDNIVVKIYATGANPEAGTLIGTSDSFDGNTLTGVCATKAIHFSNPVAITNGNSYYFVISRSGQLDDNNYYNVGRDYAGSYADGALWVNTTVSNWFGASHVLGFVIKQNNAQSSSLPTNHYFDLLAGDYCVQATPMTTNACNTVVNSCSVAQGGVYTVIASQTTKASLVSNCDRTDTGGLNVSVSLNDDPLIQLLSYDPSESVCTGTNLTVTVTAVDPDNNQLSWTWTDVPSGCATQNGVLTCAIATAGAYNVTVRACDSNNMCAQLTFPIDVYSCP